MQLVWNSNYIDIYGRLLDWRSRIEGNFLPEKSRRQWNLQECFSRNWSTLPVCSCLIPRKFHFQSAFKKKGDFTTNHSQKIPKKQTNKLLPTAIFLTMSIVNWVFRTPLVLLQTKAACFCKGIHLLEWFAGGVRPFQTLQAITFQFFLVVSLLPLELFSFFL